MTHTAPFPVSSGHDLAPNLAPLMIHGIDARFFSPVARIKSCTKESARRMGDGGCDGQLQVLLGRAVSALEQRGRHGPAGRAAVVQGRRLGTCGSRGPIRWQLRFPSDNLPEDACMP